MYLGFCGLHLTPNFGHQVSSVSDTKDVKLWHPLQSPSGQMPNEVAGGSNMIRGRIKT